MKNNILTTIIILLFFENSFAENISIQAKKVSLDKKNQTTVFEEDVNILTLEGNNIKSDYAVYNKMKEIIKLKKNIIAIDKEKNTIYSDNAEYNKKKDFFKSLGPTKIITSENYTINGKDINFDNKKGFINTNENAVIIDKDDNKIFLDNFSYSIKDYIFKSVGFVKIEDKEGNVYEFSQLYIDTKKKEIMGSDIKFFGNSENIKLTEKNKPRIFSNTLNIKRDRSTFNKSVFTLCDYRENDKCPPWTIQASQMLHDNKKKTIYYDNAVIKIYDIPILYLPKLSHPDPSIKRRSGFLVPTFKNSRDLGQEISIPYFWNINHDKNFTFTPKMFVDENPLFLGEYAQAFKNASLISDFGYTKGFKKSSNKKIKGDNSHFFANFKKKLDISNNSESIFKLKLQNVSSNKYLKSYKIDSNIVKYNTPTLENSLEFTHESEKNFFTMNTSIYEDLGISDSGDKYEYIFPEIKLDKNIFSNDKLGVLDIQTSYKVHNYDTNKYTNFLVNDFDWNFKNSYFSSGLNTKILGNLKNINYETRNIDYFKRNTTSELFGSLGHLTELKLFKKDKLSSHFLKPKLFLRYAPGQMRKEESGLRLSPELAFDMNRLDNINNFETGLSAAFGFDYEVKKNNKEFDFSVAQIINEKENKKMASETSLDEKVSDLAAEFNLKYNDVLSFKYDFLLDQNYNQFNYNEIGTSLNLNNMKFDLGYLTENKHVGDQEYITTGFNYSKSDSTLLSFKTKRNLVTDSAEFYNLSYEYINDCLRAGLVYRREFYNDSETEPENSLMFKVTLTPFAEISSPSFNQ